MPRAIQPKTVDLTFPLKGLNTAAARSVQTPDFSPDLLNVMPFDRAGRLRGASRSGTSKLYASTIGAGGIVQALQQATYVVDPNATDPTGATLWSDLLRSYSSGQVNTVATANWTARTSGVAGTLNFRTGVSTNTSVEVSVDSSTGRFYETGSSAGKAYAVVYKTSFVAPSSYALRSGMHLDYDNPMSSTDDVNGGTMRLVAGINTSDYTAVAQLITLVVCRNFVAIVEGEPSFASTAFAQFSGNAAVSYYKFPTKLSAGSSRTIELRISTNPANGETLAQGWVDGNLYISRNCTTTRNASQFFPAVGLGAQFANGAGATDYIDNLYFITGTALSTGRQVRIVAVANGDVLVGDTSSTTVATGGTAVINTSASTRVSMANSRGYAYIVDGSQNPKRLKIATQQVETMTATAGTLPTYCTLATFWRDRLILAADRNTPQNFYMSRAGTHDDFDYSQEDEGAAFAANAGFAASIGQAVIALMPLNDDELLIGCDSELWRLTGDPLVGGSCNRISTTVGVVGANAWTQDPTGTVYFVGSGGFYRIVAGGAPENLTLGVIDSAFSAINRSTQIVQCLWDRDRHGCWIFLTSQSSGASTHYWYDARTGGFYRHQFPNNHGPLCSMAYDGDGPTDRFVLLGGRVGYIYKLDDAVANDDGTAINSYVFIGPMKPVPDDVKVTLQGAEMTLGDAPTGYATSDLAATVQVYAGNSASQAVLGTAADSVAFTAIGGRLTRVVRRISGGWFFVKVGNSTASKLWSFEKLALTLLPTGRQRVQ